MISSNYVEEMLDVGLQKKKILINVAGLKIAVVFVCFDGFF